MLKKELEDVVDVYKGVIEDLKEQNQHLQKQVETLQDALICTRAPEAYRDMKVDMEGEPDLDEEAVRRHRLRAETEARYLQSVEQPLFENGDDIATMLEESLMAAGFEMGDKSLHENSES